jgi:hypothetical protein
MQMRDENGCVLTCIAADCSYNMELECLAPKIEVGDDHPTCDTFTHTPQVQRAQEEALVATCKVTQCTFNDSMHCKARGITVDHHSQHADCVTFRP